jgi:flagellar hook-associated protein 2
MDVLSTSNINNLINSSRQSEYYRRVSPILEKKSRISGLSSLWSSLKTNLNSFKSVLSDLKDVNAGGSFTAKATELTTEDYFTATANSSASLSSYNLRVDQLAKNDLVMSNTTASSDLAGLSAGTFTFQVASGEFDRNIDVIVAGTETKEELMELIADAVNEALDDAVSASVFSPKSGESKLSIVSKETGEANAITIKDVSGSMLQSIGMNFTSRSLLVDDGTGGYSASLSDLNAKLSLNGVTVERSANVIDDLITDVTLSLKNAMEINIPTVNLIVKNNMEAIKVDLKDFISKFNESYSFIKSNYYTDEDGQRGAFVGNATALGLMQSLSNTAYQKVEGIEDGNLSFLSEIGIEFDTSTGLSIGDNDVFEEAMESSPDQIAAMFNSENGIANQLYDLVDSYISTDGVISNLIESYDNSISYLADKVSSREALVDKNAEVLRRRYEQMQMQYSELLSTSNYLSAVGLFDY